MVGSVHEYALVIREQHLDTFGHVNNAKYLEILEEARWDLITRNGYGLEEVLRRRIGPTILEINLKFQRELQNRQPIVIKTWMDSYAGKIGRVRARIGNDRAKTRAGRDLKLILHGPRNRIGNKHRRPATTRQSHRACRIIRRVPEHIRANRR